MGWVIGDSGTRFASANAVTAKHIYVRLHGPNGFYATGCRKESLAVYADLYREWCDAPVVAFGSFNNDDHLWGTASSSRKSGKSDTNVTSTNRCRHTCGYVKFYIHLTTKLYIMRSRKYRFYKPLGAIILCVALLMLVFLNRLDSLIHTAIRNSTFGNQLISVLHSTGISLRKFIYLLMNWGLMVIIFAPMKNEDERIEKIRNYAYKQTFYAIVAMAVMTGLVIKDSPDLLVLTIIMQLYYLFLFHLCLYRDSRFVYLNEDQKVSSGIKMVKRSYTLLTIMGCLVAALILFTIRHDPSQLWIVVVICVAILIFLGTAQALWKK